MIATLPDHLKIIDMSADFRFRDPATYERWYGGPHKAVELQRSAVYGLTEHYREDIRRARLVACPGCYPTAVLTLVLPLVGAGLIDAGDLIIDAKSGVSGAGRTLKQNTLFCEAGEGLVALCRGKPPARARDRAGDLAAAGHAVVVNFTPHLTPMSRGELVTTYARLRRGATADDCASAAAPMTGSRSCHGAAPASGRRRNMCAAPTTSCSAPMPTACPVGSSFGALDNLVKGSAGQAIQNFNLMFGIDETTGLMQQPLFP